MTQFEPPVGLASLTKADLLAIVMDPEAIAAENEQRLRESARICFVFTEAGE